MCGINGFNWEDEGLLLQMNECIKHRGPDDEGVYVKNSVSLGHKRLSILDLSTKGHQPMFYDNENLVIIYNGEIYNYLELRDQLKKKGYTFESNTDTEVVLAAYKEWGFKCLEKFNGMWAFCIYDKNKKLFFLSRDRFGIKPLYYYRKSNKFIFASEIPPILSHKVKTSPNNRLLCDYLLYNILEHTNQTFFNDIWKIPKGSYAIFNLETKDFKIKRWWKNEYNRIKIPIDEAISKFTELLRDSVNKRLISDVPVGTCLSGGLDSSTVATLINEAKRAEITTFSAVFPGFKLDESKYIYALTDYTRIKNVKTKPNPTDFYSEISNFIEKHGEPVPGPSPYSGFCVYRLAKENNTTVLLDGQGADEILAGYHYFYGFFLKGLLRKGKIKNFLREFLPLIRGTQRKLGLFSLVFLFLPSQIRRLYFYLKGNINKAFYKKNKTDFVDRYYSCTSLYDSLKFHLNYKLEHLLKWEDRNSMAHSRESRVPFLDHRVVSFIMSLPENYIINKGETKSILRKATVNLLPPLITNRKDKIGFATPEDDWARSAEFKEILEKLFINKKPMCEEYINLKKLKNMMNAHLQNKRNYGRQLWRVIFLEIWLQKFFGENH